MQVETPFKLPFHECGAEHGQAYETYPVISICLISNVYVLVSVSAFMDISLNVQNE